MFKAPLEADLRSLAADFSSSIAHRAPWEHVGATGLWLSLKFTAIRLIRVAQIVRIALVNFIFYRQSRHPCELT